MKQFKPDISLRVIGLGRILVIVLSFLMAGLSIPVLHAQTAGAPKEGDIPPAFIYFDSAGEKIALRQYAGKTPVVLSFFATYCEPCKKEIPFLNEQSKKGSNYKLVLVVADTGSELKIAEYLKKIKADIPYIYDPSGTLLSQFNPTMYPFTVFIGKSGNIAAIKTGFNDTTKKEYNEIITQLVNK